MGLDQSLHLANSSLADALFPKVRQRVLGVLFGDVGRSFYANEVIALAQSGTGAVQRELVALADCGLLTVRKVGNQRHYQANASSPVFAELQGLVFKTVGLVDVLRNALAPVATQIELAFVYGSVAKQQDTAHSDIDVLMVSDSLACAEVFNALDGSAMQLSRKVNPTLYTTANFAKRRQDDNAFVTKVLNQPKIWLIGNEDKLNVKLT